VKSRILKGVGVYNIVLALLLYPESRRLRIIKRNFRQNDCKKKLALNKLTNIKYNQKHKLKKVNGIVSEKYKYKKLMVNDLKKNKNSH